MVVYTPCGTHTGGFEGKNNITLMVTVCIASFEVISELQRKRLHLSHATEMDDCVDNSCKQRAEYLCHSLTIVYAERGQWQALFIREKLACLTEASVMEQILQN